MRWRVVREGLLEGVTSELKLKKRKKAAGIEPRGELVAVWQEAESTQKYRV